MKVFSTSVVVLEALVLSPPSEVPEVLSVALVVLLSPPSEVLSVALVVPLSPPSEVPEVVVVLLSPPSSTARGTVSGTGAGATFAPRNASGATGTFALVRSVSASEAELGAGT